MGVGLGRALQMIAEADGYRPLTGYGRYGPGLTATLTIGRKAGLTLGPWQEGQAIPGLAVDRSVFRGRARQVGAGNVGGNVSRLGGWYKGARERTVKFEIAFEPTRREPTARAFIAHVQQLAQQVAGDLAQREVIVRWDGVGRRGVVETASPPAAPSPTSPSFCAWVRRHSRAGKSPSDPCHR